MAEVQHSPGECSIRIGWFLTINEVDSCIFLWCSLYDGANSTASFDSLEVVFPTLLFSSRFASSRTRVFGNVASTHNHPGKALAF